jgi:hypothetical protein
MTFKSEPNFAGDTCWDQTWFPSYLHHEIVLKMNRYDLFKIMTLCYVQNSYIYVAPTRIWNLFIFLKRMKDFVAWPEQRAELVVLLKEMAIMPLTIISPIDIKHLPLIRQLGLKQTACI